MRLALVTGASGFIGRHLTHALRDAGWRVRALEHRSAARDVDERVHGDLADLTARARAVDGVDCVFHCAALLDPIEPARADAINRVATVELARAARDAGVRCFVFVSSQAVLGVPPGSGPLDERAAGAPATIYGQSKAAAERDLMAFDAAPMRIAIVRPPTVYGRGERRNFLVLTRAIASGVFPLLGRGENRVSFCHVENLSAALLFIEAHASARGVLHVADARPVTLREAVDTIARAAGARRLPLHVPLSAARAIARAAELAFAPLGRRAPLDRARLDTLTRDRPLDTSKIAGLGFVPPVDFDEGVRETVAHYRADRVL